MNVKHNTIRLEFRNQLHQPYHKFSLDHGLTVSVKYLYTIGVWKSLILQHTQTIIIEEENQWKSVIQSLHLQILTDSNSLRYITNLQVLTIKQILKVRHTFNLGHKIGNQIIQPCKLGLHSNLQGHGCYFSCLRIHRLFQFTTVRKM
jgi:hypothetical protein